MIVRVIISGGGTGGHIFPAIAIANQLMEQIPTAEILFVGALGKMEMEKVPDAGYRIVGLPVAGLHRKKVLKNISLPFKLIKSISLAKKVVNNFVPHLVIGVGGYASGPLLWVASRKKIPCLIQEQNAYPGITNKLLAKKAQRICVAYPHMERFFPKEKIQFTGNPVRSAIVPVTEALRQKGRTFFHIHDNHKCILVIGGSLGAKKLNDCVKKYIEGKTDPWVEVIWQCGEYYKNEVEAFLWDHPNRCIHLHPFISKMDLAFSAADVVVSRSGAVTVSELCVAGKAVIFVPSPNVSEDHQTKNAKALVEQNAALIIPEVAADNSLMDAAIHLANDSVKREQLATQIAALARPEATKEIVREALKLINKGN